MLAMSMLTHAQPSLLTESCLSPISFFSRREATNHIRNKVNSTLRKLRKNYYTNRIQIIEGNLKKTWKVLKEAIGQNDKTCSVDKIVIDYTNQTDKVKIADAFNNHFVSIGEKNCQ